MLTPNVKYDSARDFEPVGLTANAPAVIVARKDFPAENLSEFVAYLKENGEKLKQAHGGIGASSHMACLLFNQALGIRPTSVAYRGTGPAMNDLVGSGQAGENTCEFRSPGEGGNRALVSHSEGCLCHDELTPADPHGCDDNAG